MSTFTALKRRYPVPTGVNTATVKRSEDPTMAIHSKITATVKRSEDPTMVTRSRKCIEGLGIYPYIPDIASALLDETKQVINVFAPTGLGKSAGISAIWYIENMREKLGRQMYFSIPTVLAVRKMYDYLSGMFKTDDIGFSANCQFSKNHKKAEVCLYTTQSLINHLLAMYSAENTMSDVFVVIDEAHHPSYENYVLMKYCDWLISQGKKLRVLITTATPNFSSFPNLKPSCVFDIKGESKGIEICYADSAPFIPSTKRGEFVINIESAIEKTVSTVKKVLSERPIGHILVFVPGEPEGISCMERLCINFPELEFHVLCSSLSNEDMREITEGETGKRKVIFSTNIAESSVTIKNLTVVVDMLLQKERVLHTTGNIVISTTVIPLDSSIQRRGRVGRTQFGYYYPICDQHFFSMMRPHNQPIYHLNDKLSSVMNLFSNGLPANDILQLDFKEFDEIMDILHRNDLFCFETNTIKPNGKQISRLTLPIDIAMFLIEYCNGRSYLDCLIPIALISLISARNTVSNVHYFNSKDRQTKNTEDKFLEISARCQEFATEDLFFDGLIRAWASFKTSGRSLSEWSQSYSFNAKFFKTAMTTFDRLCKELKPDVSNANWNAAWKEVSYLFRKNDFDYDEIHHLLRKVYPLVLRQKRGDIYVDSNGVEYYLDKMRMNDICPPTITVVSVYSFLSQKKIMGVASNVQVQHNIVSLAF